jgi:peptidoglycan/xylan/chitin deacetylase (PgdA/CDA1 family)
MVDQRIWRSSGEAARHVPDQGSSHRIGGGCFLSLPGFRGERVRLVVKRAVEIGICRTGLASLARRLRRQDVLVLAYHNVVPDGESVRGELSLHIGQEQLHRQLSMLSRMHQFTTVDRILEQGSGTPRVAITFDDAYRGAIQLGGEVLADLDVPATVFVAPGYLGGQRFWWDVLAHEHGLEQEGRDFALSELQGKAPSVLAWADLGGQPEHVPAHYLSATEAELDSALGIDGLTLASHTWSHPNLTTLPESELASELVRPLDWLRERYPQRALQWLSYPYGLWSSTTARVARRVGYRGAFRIEGGWMKEGVDPFEIPRVNVPAGLSIEGLELRCSGLKA